MRTFKTFGVPNKSENFFSKCYSDLSFHPFDMFHWLSVSSRRKVKLIRGAQRLLALGFCWLSWSLWLHVVTVLEGESLWNLCAILAWEESQEGTLWLLLGRGKLVSSSLLTKYDNQGTESMSDMCTW